MDAVDHVSRCAEEYCAAECERIALANEPRANVLEIEGRDLTEKAARLEEQIHRMPRPAGDPRSRKRRVSFYWTMGILLIFAAFAFAVIGFGPYRLGLIGILYCLGIAVVTPYAVHEFLRAWESEVMLKAAAAIVFGAALLGGALLAVVRGDLLMRETAPAAPAAVIEDEEAPAADSHQSFFEATEIPLKLLLLLFAIAIDLGGGVAIHRARREASADDEAYRAAMEELAGIQARLAAAVSEVTALRNAPALVAAEFWRDFYRAMLTETGRRAVRRALSVLVLAFALGLEHGSAAERLNVAIALDLSASEGVKGSDGKTPFDKNVAAVARLFAAAREGSHITVIGITEDSMRDPTPILAADITNDRGAFGERLNMARAALVRAWRSGTARLEPNAAGTDILGALVLASGIFQSRPHADRSVLVILSDMRNSTATLNLEAPLAKPTVAVVKGLLDQGNVADLRGVTVYVVGANGGGRDVGEWQQVKDFWLAYFERAHAQCGGYAILSVPPTL
jgi:hypothetical protein